MTSSAIISTTEDTNIDTRSLTWKQEAQMLSEQSAMLSWSMILHLKSCLVFIHFSHLHGENQ